MKTKRFILMLLVMLGSVTGAWAQDLHTHQFGANGICTVEDCGYNAKELVGFFAEVEDESILGGSQSTNKDEIINIFDGDTGTKWQPTTGDWLGFYTVTAIFKTLQPVVVNGYSFYCKKGSGRDSNDCVPKSWKLYGYNTASQSWDLLDAIEDNAASPNCYNSYRFRNEEGLSYQYFKWEVTNTDYSGVMPPYKIQIGEFTLDAQDVQHAHSYSENWSSDDTGHWHQCLNEFGECDAPINDFTAHTHTSYDAVCDVCGHINNHEHEWDVNVENCLLCGAQHTHQFNGDGVCTTANCGYDAKELVGFFAEVEDESILGGSQSTNKNEICNLFDGNTGTKWQPTTGNLKGFYTVTAVFKTLQPVVVNGYSFYCEKRSGWDWDSDDCVLPKSWNLYGYNTASQSWDLLDAIEDNAASPNCYNSYSFRNEEGLSYQYFKWEVTNTDYSGVTPPYKIQIGEFTLDAQYAQHAHRYSENWYSDDTGHWHQCLNEFGECDAPINDFTTHTHTIYAAVCDVCGHMNTHEHEWDDYVICRLCGIPHTHQFDGNGKCTVSGCGYSVSDTDGFLSGVNETIGGNTPSGNFMNLFDGDNDTKWTARPTAVAIFKTQTPTRVNGYSFTSSRFNDLNCHPKSWKLYGLNEADTWVELHSVTDASVGEGWNNYRFINTDKYTYYKLEVTAVYIQNYPYGHLYMGDFTLDIHNHNYEWRSDETKHWMVCVNEEGTCNIKKKSEGTHSYDDTAEQGSEPYYICSICGHIDPVRQHIHDYSEEWSSDGTHHWHKCTSTLGTCVEPREGETTHSYHESYTCDADNYMCSICGYVDEAKKAQFDERNYFSLRAVDGNVTLGMQKTGGPDNCTLQVSADGNIWSEPMTLSETTANIVTIPSGETRYFRRGSTTAADRISDDADNYWTFSMDGSANVEADGNMMSLLDMTCQQSTIANEAAFLYLFKGCTLLKSVTIKSPVLLTCGPLRDIFGGQVTSFIIDTDVTTIGNQSFQNTAITSIIIPEGVTSIGNNSFGSCSGLTSIVIPSTVRSIGANAFNRCRITQYTLNCPSSCAFGDNALSGASGYKIIVPALTTHSWTSNPMWSTYGSHFTEPTFTLHANEDPDNAGNYYTTFFNSHYAYTLPNGVKAYTATIGEENNEKVVMLTAIEGDILPKGTAVLLHSNTTGDMLMTVSNENGNEYGENLFSGVDVETAQSGTNYMLSYGQNGLGFYKMKEDMMLSANKTFLPQSAAMANARAFRMVFTDDNEVDGIQRIENGESEIENSAIYNLNGMRMNKLQKGINIVNGKKVIVK